MRCRLGRSGEQVPAKTQVRHGVAVKIGESECGGIHQHPPVCFFNGS
jgi:hypothetical protein